MDDAAQHRPLALRATTKLRAYVSIAALGALAALIFGRPAFVAATAPLALYVLIGLGTARSPGELTLRQLRLGERVREGETLEIELQVRADVDLERVELVLDPGRGLRAVGPRPAPRRIRGGGRRPARRQRTARPERPRRPERVRVVTRLQAGQAKVVSLPLVAERWGAPHAGAVGVRATDRLGVLAREAAPVTLARVGVLPGADTLRELVDPLALRATVGNRVARRRGEGIELAELRGFAPGDALRRINWRVSARRGALHVSDRHPELGADIVLLLDTFSDVGDDDESTLALAVRAAAGVAAGYLRRQDRVGVIGFGGVLSGLGPGLGNRQLQRIVATLIASEVTESYASKRVATIPRGLLPPRALVIALTPLVDSRSALALLDLRARRFDLVVLEISPEPWLPEPEDESERVARRLWRLRRQAMRDRLQTLGVTVVRYEPGAPVQDALMQAAHARRGRAGAPQR